MKIRWEKELDIRGPLEQAERCLDLWLEEENRRLTQKQRQRAAALMARYFYHEDEVTDQLMLSFLRHYSNQNEVDMEDPTSVRMEIKAVLDKAHEPVAPVQGSRRQSVAFVIAIVIVAASLSAWNITHSKITREQQSELKSLVHQIETLDPQLTSAAIWNSVKAQAHVRRYEDMTWWDYRRGREMLEERLHQLSSRTQ